MIIDNNINILRLYRDELEEEGYDVMVAASGKEALEKLERENPALVTLECFLPDIDGLTLLGQIKERRPQTPVLLVTAFDYTDAFAGIVSDGFILKSSDLSELKENIKKYAGIRREENPDLTGVA
jgi:DNA-binding response OmpR family regulator